MEHYLGVSRDERIGEEEIGAVEAIVMAVSACRVRSQYGEVRARSRKRGSSKK